MKVIFWTQGGNTGALAQAIGDGITAGGKTPEYVQVGSASSADIENEQVFAMGCPAMGDEVLEESEMEPFMEEIEGSIAGKTILLFGSYGWGDGQWMRDWVERVQKAGATVFGGEGLICNEAPDDETVAKANELGKALAAL